MERLRKVDALVIDKTGTLTIPNQNVDFTKADDIDLEMRDKYHDQIQLEKDRISAARAVGVAFGNGQKPTTTNVMWLK